MKHKFIEATNVGAGGFNYGKFMVGIFEQDDWGYRSKIDVDRPLLAARGWTPHHLHVLDIQTGEGAIFLHGGLASADLEKHKIWVCPLFEPFLEWLYKQDVSDLDNLPATVEIADPSSAMYGYRRPGSQEKSEAQKLYEDHTGNHPTIHSNRFPAWGELSDLSKQVWIDKAQTHS